MAYENQLQITSKFLTNFPRKLSKRLVKYKIFVCAFKFYLSCVTNKGLQPKIVIFLSEAT